MNPKLPLRRDNLFDDRSPRLWPLAFGKWDYTSGAGEIDMARFDDDPLDPADAWTDAMRAAMREIGVVP